MNYSSLGLAALGGTVASFAFGFLVFWLLPGLIKEGHKYPTVFRPKEKMMKVMPVSDSRRFRRHGNAHRAKRNNASNWFPGGEARKRSSVAACNCRSFRSATRSNVRKRREC